MSVAICYTLFQFEFISMHDTYNYIYKLCFEFKFYTLPFDVSLFSE